MTLLISHFIFPSNKMTLPHLTAESSLHARINPQFIGISHVLENKKKKHKEVYEEQTKIVNRVLLMQKEQSKAQKKLQQKKKQFDYLMKTLNRKREESEEKIKEAKKKEEELQALREMNRKKKQEHRVNKRNVFLELYDSNRSQYQKMRHTFTQNLLKSKLSKQLQEDSKKQKALEVSLKKKMGKKRIDDFYRSRNDSFTQEYKIRIDDQEQMINRSISTVKWLQNEQNDRRQRLEVNTSRISQLQQLITQTYKSPSPAKIKTNLCTVQSTSQKNSNDLRYGESQKDQQRIRKQ